MTDAQPQPPVPAIGYIRVSMMREEAISPETQRAAVEDWARRHRRRVTDWIEDLDKTGRNFKRRIMDAIGRIEAGDAREIIVWKYSRFGRNRHGVAVNLARLEKAGGHLQSATEDVDARTATGRFTRGMLFEVAAFESDRAAETWAEAHEHRIRAGLPPLGRRRFGYQRLGRVADPDRPRVTHRDMSDEDGERYVPDPETGPALAEMYRRYTSGDGAMLIARWLNDQGHRTTLNRRWGVRAVLRVLDSGFGAGYLHVHAPSCGCAEPGRCPQRAWIRGSHEPVIGEELWARYRERRDAARTDPPRRAVYPVSGIVRCGHCGAAMAAGGGGSKDGKYFVCTRYMESRGCGASPTIPVTMLVQAVKDEIAKWAAGLDEQTRIARSRMRERDSAAGAIERISRDLASKDRALARLARQRAEEEDSSLPVSPWETAAAEILAERHQLEAELKAARRAEKAAASDPLPVVAGILEEWDTLPAAGLREMLTHLVRVTVRRLDGAQERQRDAAGRFLPRPASSFSVMVTPVWEIAEDDPGTI